MQKWEQKHSGAYVWRNKLLVVEDSLPIRDVKWGILLFKQLISYVNN